MMISTRTMTEDGAKHKDNANRVLSTITNQMKFLYTRTMPNEVAKHKNNTDESAKHKHNGRRR